MTTNAIPTNTIIHGDCTEEMKRLPDECIPLTVTSPPYIGMRDYGGHGYGWDKFQQIAKELARITMQGGVICWVVRNKIEKKENLQAEREKLFFADECGLWAHQTIIGVPSGDPIAKAANLRYSSAFDYIFVLSKGRPRHVNVLRDKRNKMAGKKKNDRMVRNPDGTERIAGKSDYTIREFGYRTNVWSYAVGGGTTASDDVSRDHPARMPEKLAEDLIISFSKPHDLVFDPFAGAGTTLKMALLNNRQWLGIEVYDRYVEIIRRRMEHAKSQHRMRIEKALRGMAA